MKNVLIHLDDDEAKAVGDKKGDLTWKAYLLREVKGGEDGNERVRDQS